MELRNLPLAVQKLAALGDSYEASSWADYRALGISEADIPTLIEIVRHTGDFWADIIADEEDPEIWMPLHAWRALAQLHASEALPELLATLRLIEEADSDLVQEELPDVFRTLGPVAIPAVSAYLLERDNEMWARIATADGLKRIAGLYPETRGHVIDLLLTALDDYTLEDPTFNGFLISYLMELGSIEAAPLVEEIFQSGQIDESIVGDWEDYQIGVGLLEKRLNPPRLRHTTRFEDDQPALADIRKRLQQNREETKAQSKRKQAKATHKKNHKAKSKTKKKKK